MPHNLGKLIVVKFNFDDGRVQYYIPVKLPAFRVIALY